MNIFILSIHIYLYINMFDEKRKTCNKKLKKQKLIINSLPVPNEVGRAFPCL